MAEEPLRVVHQRGLNLLVGDAALSHSHGFAVGDLIQVFGHAVTHPAVTPVFGHALGDPGLELGSVRGLPPVPERRPGSYYQGA